MPSTSINENFKLLGGAGTISVDGDVGKETWGAIYDLYQYNMAQELGEDLDGVGKLRELVTVLPTEKPFIGFGESAPVDGIMADNVEAQVNRRVEVLFFAKGQEPDLAVLKEEPKLSELHLPEVFEREEIERKTGSARKQRLRLEFVGEDDKPLADFEYTLTTDDGLSFSDKTKDGVLSHKLNTFSASAKLVIDELTIDVSLGASEADAGGES